MHARQRPDSDYAMKSSDAATDDFAHNIPRAFYRYVTTHGVTQYAVKRFRTIIYRYYSRHARSMLPWRRTDDPYQILVSEIMLQQTQAERVLIKYPLFIRKFPDFRSLARARVGSLYAVWQGMGYNRRALALRAISQKVIKPPYHGRLPADIDLLMTLPFVGQSTAGAIMAFAFQQPVIFIETNIRRVFIHFFFREEGRITDRSLLPLIEKTLDRKNPGIWYYALMDYGAALRNLKDDPNRKSARYKRQSRFAGSRRQLRGRILRIISDQGELTIKALVKQLHISRHTMLSVVDELCREGFIKKIGNRVKMA